MENLFKEFDAIGKETWLEKIQKDLKGKSEDLLKYEVEKGINVTSYQHRSDYPSGTFANGKSGNLVRNRKNYPNASNQDILSDLNEGVDHIALTFTSQSEFDAQTQGIQFEHINSEVKFNKASDAVSFSGPSNCRLNFDYLGNSSKAGEWQTNSTDFLKFYAAQADAANLWISGSLFGQAGSSATQELAFSMNLLNEYLEILKDGNQELSGVANKITIELSVTEDYFLNVAKFKVARQLVATVLTAHGISSSEPVHIVAVTSTRKLAINDANNNLLRQTTQAMSAMVGGCNAITISEMPEANEVHVRMAKNIPLVLKEESYFDKVGDPAEGSYYVQELCTQLSAKSWKLFQEIEKSGGYCKAIESNIIQDAIAENCAFLIEQMNNGKSTFLGVNKFPSSLEEWTDVATEATGGDTKFKALSPFSLEGNYKKELHEQS